MPGMPGISGIPDPPGEEGPPDPLGPGGGGGGSAAQTPAPIADTPSEPARAQTATTCFNFIGRIYPFTGLLNIERYREIRTTGSVQSRPSADSCRLSTLKVAVFGRLVQIRM
jgi:hypothetical protein